MGGRSPWQKSEAGRAYHRRYEKTEKRRAWKRAYDKKRAQTPKRRAWVKVYKERYGYRSLYGLSIEQYAALRKAQGDLCAMCGNPAPKYKRTHRLYVDHDHSTNRVRALLCQPCNLAVGQVETNSNRLELARVYLAAYS